LNAGLRLHKLKLAVDSDEEVTAHKKKEHPTGALKVSGRRGKKRPEMPLNAGV
jgi:hypothetical protein